MNHIEAMKQALEALEHGLQYVVIHSANKYRMEYAQAITSLRQAIAEAEKQEPVAITITGKLGNIYSFTGDYSLKKGDKVYTSPPQRQPLTDKQFLELILRKGTQELVGVTTFVPADTKTHGQIALMRSAKIIKEFVEAAHGIKENTP